MPPPCVFGCSSYDRIHVFPDPEKYPDRFKIWVEVAGGKLETPEDYIKYRRKKVCGIHFTEKEKTRSNRLTALAVPTLHIPKRVSKPETVKDQAQKLLNDYKKTVIPVTPDKTIVMNRPTSPALKVSPCNKVYTRRKSSNCERKHQDSCKDKTEPDSLQQVNEEVIEHVPQQPDIKPHLKFNCVACSDDIFGSFYVCVECENFNICDNCCMKNEHNEHYLLRIPGCKPYSGVQSVVHRLQKQLLCDDKSVNTNETSSDGYKSSILTVLDRQKQLLNGDLTESENTNDETNFDMAFKQSQELLINKQEESDFENNPLFEGEIPDPSDDKKNLDVIKEEAEYFYIKDENGEQIQEDCYTIETESNVDNSISYTIVGLDNPVSVDSQDEDDTVMSSGEDNLTSMSNESGVSKREHDDEESLSSESNKTRFTYGKWSSDGIPKAKYTKVDLSQFIITRRYR